MSNCKDCQSILVDLPSQHRAVCPDCGQSFAYGQDGFVYDGDDDDMPIYAPRPKFDLKALVEHIKHSEGYSSTPYRCPAGKLTIGFGTNIEQITQEEAELLLLHRLGKAINEVHVAWPFVKDLHPGCRTALYDMAYNMGVSRLMHFKKMFSALEANDYMTAAAEAKDSKWFRQVGKRGEAVVKMIEEK